MIKSGDVFSISTSKGYAFFQYVKKLPPMGAMIRVLPGIFDRVPGDLSDLVSRETNFWVFFPVAAAEKLGIVKKIQNIQVPIHAMETPVFRAGIVDPSTKRVETWWFWNGEKEWMVGEISEEQRKLPIRQAWNDTLLVERIEEGWLPERDKF
jgi:hypothetical protein